MQTNENLEVVHILCFYLCRSLSRSAWPSQTYGMLDRLMQIDNHIHNALADSKLKVAEVKQTSDRILWL